LSLRYLFIVLLLILYQTVVFASSDELLLDSHHGGDGSAWGLAQCDSCHPLNFIHDNTDHVLRDLVREKAYASCAGCHGENGVKVSRPCVICHNNNDLPYTSGQTGENSHNFISQDQLIDYSKLKHSKLSDENCLSCHDSSNMDGQFDLNVDLTRFVDQFGSQLHYKKSSDFCLACHNRDHQQSGFEMPGKHYRDPLIAMEDNYNFIDKHGIAKGSGQRTYSGLRDNYRYPAEVACTDCHAMHGTHNDKLIIANAFHGASRLSSMIKTQNISINSNNGEYAQLCVVCHLMDKLEEEGHIDPGNGLSGVHQANGSCQDCHRHGMAVQTGL